MDTGIVFLLLLSGYLFGSIPFGLVLCRFAGYGDIRNIGSGNIGATNVLRTGNKALALLTLLLDGGKGALAALAAGIYLGMDEAVLAGFGAVLGHMFPVWLKFKGGKGVATTLGTLIAAVPFAGLISCAIWMGTALIFRISSLAALTAMALSPLITLFFYRSFTALIVLLIALAVWVRHKDNIIRLAKGEEPRIGKKKDEQQSSVQPE
jgi:glycerol-3-phosphate acyltransferase PlsY